ncbi:hypothetical protein [Streptomyces spongiae]|uniref:Uncharacterized protein n=1 Tax=Streptomyces spongiae TaxID=565072 RepID=A0A5N8XHN1_9ACTN|nr:hypothetical protein [Streptomyces spongiae]MPY58075.1 hypothetical protein [Streptomyces spongiae]
MTDTGLVPAGPGAARREPRRSIPRTAGPMPMAPAGVVIVINQRRGAGRHQETAATTHAGPRVAAAPYAVLAVASRRPGRGLVGLLTASDSRTSDKPARHLAVVGHTYLAATEQVAGVTGIAAAAAVGFVGRVGRVAPA